MKLSLPQSEKKDKVQISATDELNFLDMKMSWSSEGDQIFEFFSKMGQKLKYVGSARTHTPITLFTIPPEALNQIEKYLFNTIIQVPKDYSIFLDHAKSLLKEVLTTTIFIYNGIFMER